MERVPTDPTPSDQGVLSHEDGPAPEDEPDPEEQVLAALAGSRSPDVLVLLGPDFAVRWISPSVKEVFGHAPGDLIAAGLTEFVHFDDLGPIVNGIAEARRIDSRHAAVECRLRSSSMVWVPSRVTSTSFDHAGETWWVLSIRAVADDDIVIGRRVRLQALAQETALTCSEMRSDEQGILVTIIENLATAIGARAIAIWSASEGDMVLSANWSRDQHGSVPRPVAPRAALAANGYVVHSGVEGDSDEVATVEAVEVELPSSRSESGVLVAELTEDAGEGDWDGFNADLTGVIGGLVYAASRRADSEQALLERAETDQLTGLLNSAAVKERMTRMIKESPDGSVAAVFGDLDGFKALNDQLGHRTGDDVLVAVADGLRAGAGPETLIGRIGGDEFVAVRMVRGSADAIGFMTKCRSAVKEALSGFPDLGISLGVGLSEPGDSAVDLLHRADVDMYIEKRRKARMAAQASSNRQATRMPEIPR